jgi:hypothetical protein
VELREPGSTRLTPSQRSYQGKEHTSSTGDNQQQRATNLCHSAAQCDAQAFCVKLYLTSNLFSSLLVLTKYIIFYTFHALISHQFSLFLIVYSLIYFHLFDLIINIEKREMKIVNEQKLVTSIFPPAKLFTVKLRK